MFEPTEKLLHSISTALRERRDLVLEILALRAQIDVLKRSTNRPRFSAADRLFWILLSHCWDRWPEALEIVEPERPTLATLWPAAAYDLVLETQATWPTAHRR